MADLTHIFGGPLIAPDEPIVQPPEQQLMDAMLAAGITPPDQIIMDGQLHRFKSYTKGKGGVDKSGWYILFPDNIPAGRFGCWRADIEQPFRADIGKPLSVVDEMALAKRMSEASAIRKEAKEKTQTNTATTVKTIWSNALAADAEHPYLKRKGVQPHTARITGDGRLMFPLYDGTDLVSIQYIGADGDKKFHLGGKTTGSYFVVGGDVDKTLYIAEGFATAATLYEVTGIPTVACYSASNMLDVAPIMREKYLNATIVVIGDNDESGVGQSKAKEAADIIKCRHVIPPEIGDANDYHQNGGDLITMLQPADTSDFLMAADDFSLQPAPIKWMIKNVLQDQSLMMLVGPSGGGKTFTILDMVGRIAGGLADWMGHKVNHGEVVYLAGEGHHGLRARIAGWKQHNQCDKLNLWISKHGCDLNTPEGYEKVANSISQNNITPRLIVVDTLHRFLDGDENSAVDTKTMLDYCARLMNEFNCAVLLVHHTGVSAEAQHRGRGSSAWRGALDIEINVSPRTETEPMIISQKKAKDSEPFEDIAVELQTVTINGWFDEDGEPVTTAVCEKTERAEKVVQLSEKQQDDMQIVIEAWKLGQFEFKHERAFVSNSILREIAGQQMAAGTVKQWMSGKGRGLHKLAELGILENASREHGWFIIDESFVSQIMLSK